MNSKVSILFCFAIVSLLNSNTLFGQLYYDASQGLPDMGASGQSVDVQSADLDNDGDFDIVLANEYQVNAILYNEGSAQFLLAPPNTLPSSVHDSEDIAIADFNADGFLDIVFVSEDTYEHEYYINNGLGQYSMLQFLPFTECAAAAAYDFNNDGFTDLFIGNLGQNMILINDQTGHLVNETADRLPAVFDQTHDAQYADIDGDGDGDLLLGNEHNNQIWINDGFGYFEDQSAARLPSVAVPFDSRKLVVEDVDGDGDLDIFLATVMFTMWDDAQNRLFLNDGAGYFTDVTATHLPLIKDQSLDAVFLDVDVDGDQDLVIGGVLDNPLKCYVNNGVGQFETATEPVFGDYMDYVDTLDIFSLINKDFNADGYDDIYIANRAGKDVLLLRDTFAVMPEDPLAVEDFTKTTPSVFPNPAQQQVTVHGLAELPVLVHFVDQQGKVVAQLIPRSISELAVQISWQGQQLPAGMYYVQLFSPTSVQLTRLFIH